MKAIGAGNPGCLCRTPTSWAAAACSNRVASRLSLRSRDTVAGTGLSSSGRLEPQQHMAGRARHWNKQQTQQFTMQSSSGPSPDSQPGGMVARASSGWKTVRSCGILHATDTEAPGQMGAV